LAHPIDGISPREEIWLGRGEERSVDTVKRGERENPQKSSICMDDSIGEVREKKLMS